MGPAAPASECFGPAQRSSESSEDKKSRMYREGVLLLQEGMFLVGGGGRVLAQCPAELLESRAMWPGHTAIPSVYLWHGIVLTRQGVFIEQHSYCSESGRLGLGSALPCHGILAEDLPHPSCPWSSVSPSVD